LPHCTETPRGVRGSHIPTTRVAQRIACSYRIENLKSDDSITVYPTETREIDSSNQPSSKSFLKLGANHQPRKFIPEAMSTSLQHSKLGELRGNLVDGTVQFLGLKYASLKNRLASAELISNYGQDATDATKYGYAYIYAFCMTATDHSQTTSCIPCRCHKQRVRLHSTQSAIATSPQPLRPRRT
jgi:hypothetical protein